MTVSEQFLWGVNVIVGLTVIASFFRAGRAERRAEEAHQLAAEGHEWRREEAERARRHEEAVATRQRWCQEMRDEVDANDTAPVEPDVPMEWINWGEEQGYFKRSYKSGGIIVLERGG